MTTLIPGPIARPIARDSFTHLTRAQVVSIDADGVLFDADLSPELARTIHRFIASRDDADMVARANLRNLAATATAPEGTTDDIKALLRAAVCYLLGDTP